MSRLARFSFVFAAIACMSLLGCKSDSSKDSKETTSVFQQKLSNYAVVALTADLSVLDQNEKKLIPLLMQASRIIDDVYWAQVCGFDRQSICDGLEDEYLKRYIEINYGPWDRLDGMKPFVEGIGAKPLGAQFYPDDMSYDEFQNLRDVEKFSQYTILRRNEFGRLVTIPYHVAYREKLNQVIELLQKAGEISENEAFKNYLF